MTMRDLLKSKIKILKSSSSEILLIPLFFTLLLVLKMPVLNAPFHWDGLSLALYAKTGGTGFMYLASVLGMTAARTSNFIFFSHVIIVLISTLAVFLTYLLGKNLFNKDAGLISALMLLFSNTFFVSTGIVYYWIPITFVFLISLYIISLLYKKIEVNRNLKKYNWLFAAITFLVIGLHQLYRKKIQSYVTPLILNSSKVIIEQKISIHAYNIFLSNGKFLLVPFMLIYLWKTRNNKGFVIFSALVTYVFLMDFWPMPIERHILPIIPIFFILGSKSLINILGEKKAYLTSILIIIVFIISWNFNYNYRTQVKLEKSMSYMDSIKVHMEMAEYIESNFSDSIIVTKPQQSIELSEPTVGYVDKPIDIIKFEFNGNCFVKEIIQEKPGIIQKCSPKKELSLKEKYALLGNCDEINNSEKLHFLGKCNGIKLLKKRSEYNISFNLNRRFIFPNNSKIEQEILFYNASEQIEYTVPFLQKSIEYYNVSLIKKFERKGKWTKLYGVEN